MRIINSMQRHPYCVRRIAVIWKKYSFEYIYGKYQKIPELRSGLALQLRFAPVGFVGDGLMDASKNGSVAGVLVIPLA